MLKVEVIEISENNMRNKNLIFTFFSWIEIEDYSKLKNNSTISKEKISEKIKNKYIKFTCLENQYIDVSFKKYQTSYSYDNHLPYNDLIFNNDNKE